jgi:hypothetical protein
MGVGRRGIPLLQEGDYPLSDINAVTGCSDLKSRRNEGGAGASGGGGGTLYLPANIFPEGGLPFGLNGI